MPIHPHQPKQRALRQRQREYEQVKSEIGALGYVLQGTVIERWKECGQPVCRCHRDPEARHGPYWQWSWKEQGKTVTVYLDRSQVALCKEWIANSRRLRRLNARMYKLSKEVARLHEIPPK